MTSPAYHTTWTRLQALDRDRDWLRFGEVWAAVKAAGIEVSEPRLRRELARLPKPPKRYGMFLYTPDHVAAVISAIPPAAAKETTT